MGENKSKRISNLVVGVFAVIGLCAVILVGARVAIYEISKHKNLFNVVQVDNRPIMPIEVTFRHALLSNGLVARFKDVSGRNLEVLVTFENPTLNKSNSFTISLAPGNIVEFGHLQGWDFMSGDKITVIHHDYRPLIFQAP